MTQITRTFYDDEATGTPTQITPKNLRGRIAAVKVFEDGQTQGAATFYDYDIHGNVEKLVQQLPDLDPKTVEYSYDLLSGNVHRVTYQKGETDQFMHRYTYDADNRLEAVFTSSDGYIWDEDTQLLVVFQNKIVKRCLLTTIYQFGKSSDLRVYFVFAAVKVFGRTNHRSSHFLQLRHTRKCRKISTKPA